MNSNNIDVLLFAGGTGRRMKGSNRPKQFLELGGKPLILYTIEQFAYLSYVTGIVVVCLESWIPYLDSCLTVEQYGIPIGIVPGGETGQTSIYNGLRYIHRLHPDDNEAIVLVHDGVRPLINEEAISSCVESVRKHGSTAVVAPAVETIVVCDDAGKVKEMIDRSKCRLARAPQGFFTEELYDAHRKAQEENKRDFIDSISLMAYYGYEIFTVEGPSENIKVTTPADYFAFKGYMDMADYKQLWDGDDE